jgi:hypothetical protein
MIGSSRFGAGRARVRRRAVATVTGLVGAALSPLAPAASPAVAAPAPLSAPIESVQLSLLGSSNLASLGLDGQTKPRGQNGDVAVLGRTAFVAAGPIFHGASSSTGRICTDHGGVKVVDLTNPAQPTLQTTITMEDTKGVVSAGTTRNGVKFNNLSVTASAVDARTVSTPTFSGDVLAIATQRCEPSFFNGARLEFWDVTNRAAPAMLGVFDPANIPFTPPGGTPTTGQWGIFEDVRMFVKGGRLMAMATTPFSIGNAHDASPFGDFRLVDLNDIRNPQQVGTFPPVSLGQDTINGCRTFQAGKAAAPTPDGNGAILSWYDGTSELSEDKTAAVFKLDLNNLPAHVPGSAPVQFNPSPPFWGYPYSATTEGNAADVQPFLDDANNLQVMMSEDDLDPANTAVTLGFTGATPQQFRGCTILAGKHAFEYPGQQVAGEVVYAGRSCPASPLTGTANTATDELLADPNGKIVVMEGGGNQNDGCSAAEKAERLRQAGALAVFQNSGAETLNTLIAGPRGGIPALPVLTIPQSAYNNVQLVPSPVFTFNPLAPTAYPASWDRSSTTNVTNAQFPGRTDKGYIKSVANATDPVARAEVKAANRFNVVAGAPYNASVFLQVEAITAGAFRAAVVWYDAAGAVISESQVTSLTAVTPRTRFQSAVTAPALAVKGSVKVEWTGGGDGTAYADTFTLTRPSLQSTIKDNKGEWGAQRILNFSASPPTEVGTYRSPKSLIWPPPDNGLYVPRQARMFGNKLAFTSWMSDGLRVVDVSNPAAPREVASFVPPAATDPTPQAGAGQGLVRGPVWGDRTLVTGVQVIPTGDSSGLVVISDINAGLYVLGFQVQRAGELAPSSSTTAGPGEQRHIVGTGFLPGATVQLAVGGISLGSVTADASGSISTTITLPLDIRLGSYQITATGPAPGGGTNVITINLLVPSMGYWTVASDGGVFAFGTSKFFGSMGGSPLNRPMVGMASTPSGKGYWLVASDGGIFNYGDAKFFGSTGSTPLNQPIVGMAPTPSGNGYWLVASDGGIFNYGDAKFFGSTGSTALNRPIVGMAPTPSGNGYWLVASDGGIFNYGNAAFLGSTGGQPLVSPIVGMSTVPAGNGYRMVAADGGVFSFGGAPFLGSMGGKALNSPVVGMSATPAGNGYWLVAGDGGIFGFGIAEFPGSVGGMPLKAPMVGMSGYPLGS